MSGNPSMEGYVYDIPSNTYTMINSFNRPLARAGHTVVSNKNGTWLVWGGSTVNVPTPVASNAIKSGALFYYNAPNQLVSEPLTTFICTKKIKDHCFGVKGFDKYIFILILHF